MAFRETAVNDFDEIDELTHDSEGVTVVERVREETKPPPLYKVVMFNDDYTPMEFVVIVLQEFFGMDWEKANRVMLTIHTVGQSVVGIYPRDIAESKCDQVNKFSQSMNYPLLSTVETTDTD